ncbi:hypothetical protein AMATHDRAFT_50912 [Amanita thiersii Skay4041]|uniref:Uncharacterized protein n=1 Tax=Amanita thiersii Skay4041 TaxID=703135 RepID=A0A2A9NFS4_9AGAR|nr:hypothetical protein AMATHDRAFT_50912 [Amanita thiersii Skay4041]
MAASSNEIGDIFYPNNPRRRGRVAQLRGDINFDCEQFYLAKELRQDLLRELKPKLGNLLKKYGYHTPEELEDEVKKILKGVDLEEYKKISKEVNRKDEFTAAMLQVAGVIAVKTGIFLSSEVVLCSVASGAALTAFGIINGVPGILDNLASLFELWLDDPDISGNDKIMNRKMRVEFAKDYSKSKRSHVVKYLVERDMERHAWTKEDPNWRSGREDILSNPAEFSLSSQYFFTNKAGYYIDDVAMSRQVSELGEIEDLVESPATVTINYTSPQKSGTLELMFLTSDETSLQALDQDVCIFSFSGGFILGSAVSFQNNKWLFTYESALDENRDLGSEDPKLLKYTFILVNLRTHEFIEGCKITVVSHSTD